ncbi:hypothetical protein G7046_g4640 [Stylonectria norvegica]|nr:hypothetical protein G7046_g4640 [Stylonectria norvegica]
MATECTFSPLFGLWKPQNHLKHLYYGAGCVDKYLVSVLPSPSSKVFIITGASIATQTPLIRNLEALLGDSHAGTYAGIKQHGQEDGVNEATELVTQIHDIDTLLSVGGGSPIDSAKTISFRIHEKTGSFLTHIAIPTTLSAAECTAGGGFTRPDGQKVGFMHPGMGVAAIFYDASFARLTPRRLWLATGMRAVDHAVETMYHPNASEMPWKALAVWALATLAEHLPRASEVHGTEDADPQVTTMLQLAAFASSGLRGSNFRGGMGLSHSLGNALGSPYGIPREFTAFSCTTPTPEPTPRTPIPDHQSLRAQRVVYIYRLHRRDFVCNGETSCLTLASVIRHHALTSENAAQQIARLLPAMGGQRRRGHDQADALEVAQRVEDLVKELGLAQRTLSERGLDLEQVDIIANRAANGSPSKEVVRLVQGLF